jgi:hypothetical protein
MKFIIFTISGKGGSKIRELEENSGASIKVLAVSCNIVIPILFLDSNI